MSVLSMTPSELPRGNRTVGSHTGGPWVFCTFSFLCYAIKFALESLCPLISGCHLSLLTTTPPIQTPRLQQPQTRGAHQHWAGVWKEPGAFGCRDGPCVKPSPSSFLPSAWLQWLRTQGRSAFKFLLCSLPAGWFGITYFMSLSLSFLLCKAEIIMSFMH